MLDNKHIAIFGANTAQAKELALLYAQEGYNLYLGDFKSTFSSLSKFGDELAKKYNIKITLFDFDIKATNANLGLFYTLEPKPIGVVFYAECLNGLDISDNLNNANDTILAYLSSVFDIFADYYSKQQEGFMCFIDGSKQKKEYLNKYISNLEDKIQNSNIGITTIDANAHPKKIADICLDYLINTNKTL